MAKKKPEQVLLPRRRKTWTDVTEELASKDIAPPVLEAQARISELVSSGKLSSASSEEDVLKGINDDAKENLELDREIAFYASSIEQDKVSYGGLNGRTTYGTVSQLLDKAIPSDRRNQIRKAFQHYESDDLLKDLIDLKIDFTILGLSINAKPPLSYQNDNDFDEVTDFQEVLNDVSDKIDLDHIITDMLRDWFVTDNIILYWRTDPPSQVSEAVESDATSPSGGVKQDDGIPGIYEVSVLNPSEVDWSNSLGQDTLTLDIPPSVQTVISTAFQMAQKVGQRKPDEVVIRELMNQGIPRKWSLAVKNNLKQVVLRKEDGDNWIIRTKARKNYGLARPSMRTIFLGLEMRQMLIEGDFSAAYMMKHFIMLVKAGESVETGPMAGSRQNWLRPKEATELEKRFKNIAKAMRAVVNHTVDIKFVFPPPEIFDTKKYDKVESRIFNWSGVTVSLMGGGEQQPYSGGFISIKKMLASMAIARKQINIIISQFFNHETIRTKIDTPEGFRVAVNFDQNVLKEPRQLLDEVKFLFTSSISDPRTSALELGRDPESLKSSTLQSINENENLHVWEPVGNQGNVKLGDPGGRPANPGTEKTEDTRNQPPAPRVTENT